MSLFFPNRCVVVCLLFQVPNVLENPRRGYGIVVAVRFGPLCRAVAGQVDRVLVFVDVRLKDLQDGIHG